MSSESFLQLWAKFVIKGPGQTTVGLRPVCDSLPRRNTLLQPGLLGIWDLEALLSLQSSCLQNLQSTAASTVSSVRALEWNSHLIVISSGCCSMEIWCSESRSMQWQDLQTCSMSPNECDDCDDTESVSGPVRRQTLSGEDYLLFSAPARKLKSVTLTKGETPEEWQLHDICYLSAGSSQDDKG